MILDGILLEESGKWVGVDCGCKLMAVEVISQALRDYRSLVKSGAISKDGEVNRKLKMQRTILVGDSGNGRGIVGCAREAADFFHARGGGLEIWLAISDLDISVELIREMLLRGGGRPAGRVVTETIWSHQVAQVL